MKTRDIARTMHPIGISGIYLKDPLYVTKELTYTDGIGFRFYIKHIDFRSNFWFKAIHGKLLGSCPHSVK